MKRLYHGAISILLQIFGLDFGWYRTFYVRVFYAFPFVEPVLQIIRPKSVARNIIGQEALRYIKMGDTALDIGANVGSISSMLLSLGLKVYAFEPDSRCVALLRRRFKWFGKASIFIHHCAVSHENGLVYLNYGSITTESNSIIVDKPGADGSAGGEQVNAKSILQIIDQLGYVSLIKMDIEGAEYDVLDSLLTESNLDKFGVCLVEVHARKIPALMERQHKLEERIGAMGLSDRIILTWH